MKRELTKEESRRLIDLGVPRERMTQTVEHKGILPIVERTFTLTDLLEILPREIQGEGCLITGYLFDWFGGYALHLPYEGCHFNLKYSSEELIDVLYELTIWCIENGHIKFT